MKIDEQTTALYRIIREAAEAGDPCPSNQELGDLIGRSERITSDRLCELEANGFITVCSKGGVRSITVEATGKATATNKRGGRDDAIRLGRSEASDVREHNRKGCQALLRRQLETGAFWINDSDKLAAAWREAMPMEEAA